MNTFRCDCSSRDHDPRCPLRLEIGEPAVSQRGEEEERVIPIRIIGKGDLHSVPSIYLDRAGLKSLIAVLGKKVESLDGE